MRTLRIRTALLIVALTATACDKPKTVQHERKNQSKEWKEPQLPSSEETIMTFALYEAVALTAWDKVGERLIAGEDEVRIQTDKGEVGFIRGDGDEHRDKPSERYMVGGIISGFIEIVRDGDRVERVLLRPGEFGFTTHQTVVTLFEPDLNPLFSE